MAVTINGDGTINNLKNVSYENLTVTTGATLPAATAIGNVSSTEVGYVDGVTSSIQTQINTSGLKMVIPTSATNGSVGANGVVTFSGVSSVSLNGCFTSSFENYKVMWKINSHSSLEPEIRMRFRTSGTDNSTSAYSYAVIYAVRAPSSTGAASTIGAYNTTDMFMNQVYYSITPSVAEINVYSPYASEKTNLFASVSTASTGGIFVSSHSAVFNATTQFDGFSIYPNSGSFGGTIRVYGYNNG